MTVKKIIMNHWLKRNRISLHRLDTIKATKTSCAIASKENKQIKHNITLEQRNAINSLAQDNSIIIKEADKGGGIGLMNTDFL